MVSDKEDSPRQGSRSRSRSSSRSSSRASERKSRSPSRENRDDESKLEAQRSQENGNEIVQEEKKQVESRRRSRSKSGSASRSSSSSASRSRSRSRSKSSRRRRHSSEKRTRRRRSRSSRSGSRRSSRSRSRSRGYRGRDRYRSKSRSRSPYYRRANPSPCRVLGVFGLNYQTEEREIKRVFEKYGPVEKVKLVTDPRTGRSRGFAFIYFDAVEDAEEAKDKMHGRELDGSYVRVEFSISNREHHPTPGVYMGRRTSARYYDDDYYDSYRGGSKRAYSRSRSRSRSYDRSRRRRRSYSRDY